MPLFWILLLAAGFAMVMAAVGMDAPQPPGDENIRISRQAERSARPGPEAWFTGHVEVEMLFDAQAPSRISGARVTFQPGARTAWHSHPLGQVLLVTEGIGWVQEWGGPVREIRPGDVVRIARGAKHWHGATPGSPMTHIAIQESLDGCAAGWLEKVSAEQYRR